MLIEINDAERATILAALRVYHREGYGDPDNRDDMIHEIATDGGDCISLDQSAIDDLYYLIDVAESHRPIVVANITGGVLQGASSDVPVDLVCLDYEASGYEEAVEIPQSDGSRAEVLVGDISTKVDRAWVGAVINTLVGVDVIVGA